MDHERFFRTRGPKSWQLWAGLVVTTIYGFNMIGYTNRETAKIKLSERESRYNMVPFLQAEADREYAYRERISDAKEAEIMKDVPGWEVGKSPFNSKKWMPRRVHQFEGGDLR